MDDLSQTCSADLWSEFGGIRFPLQVATSTTKHTDGSASTYCGLTLTATGRNTQPARPYAAPKPVALTNNGDHIPNSVQYCKLRPPTAQCSSCSARLWVEERLHNTTLGSPRFNICCHEGKVSLPPIQEPPEPLRSLLSAANSAATAFRNKIRIYNSMFSFTSFGARIDETINRSRGPYAFRVSGQNYHLIGSMEPPDGQPRRFAQLYFSEETAEVDARMGCMNLTSTDVDPQIVQNLMNMLDASSVVAKAFRMAREWGQQHPTTEYKLKLIGQRQNQSRQHNLPTVPEVAALIVGDFGQGSAPRDVIVHSKNAGAQRISELHPLYMSLQYPLLFPYGEDGFHDKIPTATTSTGTGDRGHITMREYYSYRFQQRTNEGSTLIQAGKLFHQYVVDAYTAVEEQRLRWIRFNQSELRADLYNNIADAVMQGDTDARAIGQRVILPASFTGGPRYMAQNYQDAMAICRAYGNPSLFVTFTANPKWPEIEEMLQQCNSHQAHDRPDLMTRLYKLKLGQLMRDIKTKQIFGPINAGKHTPKTKNTTSSLLLLWRKLTNITPIFNAVVYTIEFQKRGLPHAHILIWLKDGHKAKTGKDIDAFISAEIPPKEIDPHGYKAVTEHMTHGPCGSGNKSAPCMVNGSCSKHFPKPFYAETTLDQEGFPVYKRRDNGVHVQKGKHKLNNSHVVPYNRYLLLKYNAHINVEWCNRSRAIKYLFKYINKGPDRATIEITETNGNSNSANTRNNRKVDEVKQYQECRYVSVYEALWRLYGFDIHYSWPSVIRLSFHLPGQNRVTMQDNQSLADILELETAKKSMFTEWFILNSQETESRELTYAELPKKYVWKGTEKKWAKRKSLDPVGRIFYCHPAAGEKYYLRMLLNVVKGPTSFEALRTVNGELFSSYRQACYARGMLTEDTEWADAIQEAHLWATGHQLRELFVTILLFCDVTSPLKLWNDTWKTLSEDILYRKRKHFRFPALQLSEKQTQTYCLLDIEEELGRHGKALSDFPDLPTPDKSLLTPTDNRLMREELAYNRKEMEELHAHLLQTLNSEQKDIYKKVLSAVTQEKGGLFFVYGAGGTGKTYLYKAVMARIRSEGNIVLAVASSGIAALLLPGGRTAHNRFLIPLELLEHSTCGITQKSHLAQLMQEVKLIIWDEAPMTQRYAFEALNRTLKDVKGAKNEICRNQLFGGIPVVLGGDFRQILPVITKGRRQDIVAAAINNSPLWDDCEVLTLTQSMRVTERTKEGHVQKEKQQFNAWLRQIGDGTLPAVAQTDEEEPAWIEIPSQYLVDPKETPIQELIHQVFPAFLERKDDKKYLQERAILTPLNVDADEINNFMFDQLQGDVRSYRSSDEICMASTDVADQQHMYPTEFLNTLDFPGIPPHELRLKEGLPVMLLRNVNPTQGLCNGTRLILTKLGQWVVEAEIITGACIGTNVFIPRITLSSTQGKWPFVMKRRQFPIKPCLAMTINKSQGQSLNVVGLYLPKPVFCHGQLYVALSRVTDPKGLKIMILPSDKHPKNHTKNIVYKEVFNNLHPKTQETEAED